MPLKVNRTDAPAFQQDNAQLLRSSPLLHLRTVIVQFIQGLFWYMPKGQYHWEPDIGTTEIVITDESPLKVKEYGTRPCIGVTRAPVTLSSLGLDDMSSYDATTGMKKKSVVVPGNMTVNCCSREALEAEFLAFFVAEHVWLLRDVLQKKSIYQIGQNIGIGAPSPAGSLVQADQGDEWTITSTAIPFQLVRTGAITPLGQHIVKDIELSLSRLPVSAQSVAFYPAGTAAPAAELASSGISFSQPYDTQQSTPQGLKPPGIRGRPIPLRGSGVGESH